MHTQPTIQFAAIAAAIIGTLWVGVSGSGPRRTVGPQHTAAVEADGRGTTHADGHGAGGERQTRGVVGTNLVHATPVSTSFQNAEWINRLGWRESRNMDNAFGDHGKAHGRYQFTAAAWHDTSQWRKKRGMAVHPFSKAHDAAIATAYVVSWFQCNRERFRAKTGHEPTIEQLFRIHRMGFFGASK